MCRARTRSGSTGPARGGDGVRTRPVSRPSACPSRTDQPPPTGPASVRPGPRPGGRARSSRAASSAGPDSSVTDRSTTSAGSAASTVPAPDQRPDSTVSRLVARERGQRRDDGEGILRQVVDRLDDDGGPGHHRRLCRPAGTRPAVGGRRPRLCTRRVPRCSWTSTAGRQRGARTWRCARATTRCRPSRGSWGRRRPGSTTSSGTTCRRACGRWSRPRATTRGAGSSPGRTRSPSAAGATPPPTPWSRTTACGRGSPAPSRRTWAPCPRRSSTPTCAAASTWPCGAGPPRGWSTRSRSARSPATCGCATWAAPPRGPSPRRARLRPSSGAAPGTRAPPRARSRARGTCGRASPAWRTS